MKDISNRQQNVSGPSLVAKAKDVMRLSRTAFEAESRGHREQQEAINEIEAKMPMLAEFEQQVQECLRSATDKEIAAHLALLVKAFPNVGKDDGAVFGRLLLDDVISQNPSIAALEAGCVHVRRTSKFLPSIAEVLEAIIASQTSLTLALDRVHDMPRSRDLLVASVREHNRKISLKANRGSAG